MRAPWYTSARMSSGPRSLGYTTWAPLGIDRTKSDSVGRRVRYLDPDVDRRVRALGLAHELLRGG